MPSHMTSLGFPVTTEQDFRHYVFAASEFGRKIKSPNGSYTLWEPGNGIELWVQTNLHKRIIGMNLHFSGHSRMQLELTRRISKPGHSIMDGALYAWANPQNHEPESGTYPLVFDVPDYDLHTDLRLPKLVTVQLAAFAHELQGFESTEAYTAAQKTGIQFAEESFIPSGLFRPGPQGGMREPPLAQAIFSGHVLVTTSLSILSQISASIGHAYELQAGTDVKATDRDSCKAESSAAASSRVPSGSLDASCNVIKAHYTL